MVTPRIGDATKELIALVFLFSVTAGMAFAMKRQRLK